MILNIFFNKNDETIQGGQKKFQTERDKLPKALPKNTNFQNSGHPRYI
jgi:hypothetical protein